MSTPSRRGLILGSLGLLGALGAGPAHAGQPRLELTVDVTELVEGQTVSARVRLIDGVMRGRPELDVGAGLRARFTGQSQQHVVVNFESRRIVEFTYALTAVSQGRWQVGPVAAQVGSATLTADPVTVTVQPRSAEEKAASDVVATLSSREPYLGQVVVYRFRHRHSDRVLDMDWTPPGFDGFVAEKTAEATQRDYQVVEDGVTFQVEEIFVPLVATAEGDRVVPPAVLTLRVPSKSSRRRSPFLGSIETRMLSSDPIPTRVRGLPSEGRPAEFSGLVGRFALRATARLEGSGQEARAGQVLELPLGQSVTLVITLTGDGTLAGLKLPAPPQDAGYRAYDDAPEVVARVEGGSFEALATFRRAVVPTQEGRLVIDPVQLSVFDPERGAYVTLKTEPVTLDVVPGEAGAGAVRQFGEDDDPVVDGREDIEALGEDILPVPAVRVRDHSLGAALRIAAVPTLVPLLGLVGMGLVTLRQRRAPDPRAALHASLTSLPTDAGARLGALEQAFRDACGLRLGRPAPGLDRDAVASLGPDAAQLYDALDRSRYGGFQVGGDLEARVRAFVEAT